MTKGCSTLDPRAWAFSLGGLRWPFDHVGVAAVVVVGINPGLLGCAAETVAEYLPQPIEEFSPISLPGFYSFNSRLCSFSSRLRRPHPVFHLLHLVREINEFRRLAE